MKPIMFRFAWYRITGMVDQIEWAYEAVVLDQQGCPLMAAQHTLKACFLKVGDGIAEIGVLVAEDNCFQVLHGDETQGFCKDLFPIKRAAGVEQDAFSLLDEKVRVALRFS